MADPTFFDYQPDGDAITRIFNTILLYAIREEAREIQVQRIIGHRDACILWLLDRDKNLSERLSVPISCYRPLREKIEAIAGEEMQIDVKMAGETYPFALSYRKEADVSDDPNGDTLILTRKPEIDSSM